MSLPLRLAVEPIAKRIFGNCFVLPSNDEERLCIIVTNYNNYNNISNTLINLYNQYNNNNVGLIAITVNTVNDIKDIKSILGLDSNDISFFVYVYKTDQWFDKGGSQLLSSPPNTQTIVSSIQATTSNTSYNVLVKKAQIIVNGIQRYYGRQVLEPSIRGFLSILEKTFPRNDLYLFELLQNAVDDGAMHVCFHVKCINGTKQNTRFELNDKDVEGLFFTHNGRRFNALDCLGLASVGLSTKGSESNGQKRTIGFMGVGFKAVYKRFAKVTIYDDVWAFSFEEPLKPAPMEPSHGWVLKPKWIENKSILWDNDTKSKSSSWCHFQLEKPRVSGISKDLSQLPSSVPALLGRQALENEKRRVDSKVQIEATGKWTLEWGNSNYYVSRQTEAKSLAFLDPITVAEKWAGSSECILVQTDTRGSSNMRRWQFISLHFLPDNAAQLAYANHTKRNWGDGTSSAREETCFFFEVGPDGSPIGSRGPRGAVHAVLPTKLKLPSAVQWQSSWLLSVDRQDVQNVGDNEWNSCLLRQAPRLFACLLMWSSMANPSDLKSVFELLPMMDIETIETNRKKVASLTATILGQKIQMNELVHVTLTEKVVPALKYNEGNQEIHYSRGKDVVWLPPPLLNILPLDLMKYWFGSEIFASTKLVDWMWLPLWKQTLTIVSSNIISSRNQFFAQTFKTVTNDQEKVLLQIRIMAALVQCVSLEPIITTTTETGSSTIIKTNNKSSANPTEKEPDTLCGDWLPQIRKWPVFLTSDKSTVLPATEIVWLDADFMTLTPDIRALLRPAVVLAFQAREKEIDKQSNQRKNVYSNNRPPLLLDINVEEALMSADNLGLDPVILADAKNCAQVIRDSMPGRVVNVEHAARFYLDSLSRRPDSVVSDSEVADILNLFAYAIRHSKPSLISFLLVEDRDVSSKGTKNHRLLSAEKTYIGSAYNSEAVDLDNLCRDSPRSSNQIYFISPIYLKHMDTVKSTTLCNFFDKCGAQRGLSLTAISRQLTRQEVSSPALNGVLPTLRSSTPSVPIYLPYGLGPLLRTHQTVVDARFTSEWKRLISYIASDVHKATLFTKLVAHLFENLDVSPIATPESTPCAAAALRGQQMIPVSTNPGVIPQDSPLPVMARLYHLPPGQPGAKAISIGPSEWMTDLASIKWVPAVMGDVPPDAPPTMVLSPAEVILPRFDDKFGNNNISSEMPVARLPLHVLKIFGHAPPAVMNVLNWGTVKPKPPLERLEKLIRATDNSDTNQDYEELVYIWRSLGIAHRENRLQISDQRKVRLLLEEAKKKKIIPAYGQLWELDRCVYLHSPNYDINLSDEELALMCFCRAGYLFDMSSSHNDASRKNEKSDWVLAHVSESLKALLQPASRANKHISAAFLNWVCQSESMQLSAASRKGFSYGTWIIMKEAVGVEALASYDFISPNAKATGLKALKQAVPDLKLLCARGPGQGPKAFSPGWLPAYVDKIPLDSVRPVLIDEGVGNAGATIVGSGIMRSSLLLPEHLLQPLGLYNHGYENFGSQHLYYEHDRALNADLKKVELIDRKILLLLGIHRTSDSKSFTLKVATGGTGEYLPEASKRIELVMNVIWEMLNPSVNLPQQSEIKLPPVSLYRHSSISIQFKTPTMVKPSVKHVFAVWGASAATSTTTSTSSTSSSSTSSEVGNPTDTNNLKSMYGKGVNLLSKFGWKASENGESNETKLIEVSMRKPRVGLGMPTKQPLKKNEKTIVNKLAMKNILIAGEADDYGHELEELVYSLILANLPTSVKADKRPVKALRLIQYVCDEIKFMKHLKRDFEVFLQQEGMIFDMLKSVDDTIDSNNDKEDEDEDDVLNYTTTLRPMETEDGEVSEPLPKKRALDPTSAVKSADPSKNDKVLEEPVNLVKDRLAARGISNKPAWMTTTTNLESNEMDVDHTTSTSSTIESVQDASLSEQVDRKDRSSEKVSILPSPIITANKDVKEIPPTVVLEAPVENLIKDRLAARGISNKPAWLTVNKDENISVEELIVENTAAASTFLDGLLQVNNSHDEVQNSKRHRDDDEADDRNTKKILSNSNIINIDASNVQEILSLLQHYRSDAIHQLSREKQHQLKNLLDELKLLLSDTKRN